MSTAFEVISGGNYPANPVEGQCVYNQDTNSPEWFNGSSWLNGVGIQDVAYKLEYTVAELNVKLKSDLSLSITTAEDFADIESRNVSKNGEYFVINEPDVRRSTSTAYGIAAVGKINTDHTITFTHFVYNPTGEKTSSSDFGGSGQRAVFVTNDGLGLVAGDRIDTYLGVANKGAVHVYDLDPSGEEWTFHQMLNHPLGNDGPHTSFGFHVMLSEDRLTLLVASYSDNDPVTNSNGLHMYRRAAINTEFTYVANLVAEINISPGSNPRWAHPYSGQRIDITADGMKVLVGNYMSSSSSSYVRWAVMRDDGAGNRTYQSSPTPYNTTYINDNTDVTVTYVSATYAGAMVEFNTENEDEIIAHMGKLRTSSPFTQSEYEEHYAIFDISPDIPVLTDVLYAPTEKYYIDGANLDRYYGRIGLTNTKEIKRRMQVLPWDTSGSPLYVFGNIKPSGESAGFYSFPWNNHEWSHYTNTVVGWCTMPRYKQGYGSTGLYFYWEK